MPEPILTQTFSTSQGDHEGVNVVALPTTYSSSLSANVRIDKLGRIKKVLGYASRPSASVTTDTGGAATQIHALFPFWKGKTFPDVVGIFHDGSPYDAGSAASEYEIHTSTNNGTSFTFRRDLGAHSVANFRPVPTAFEYGDVLYMAIAGEAPQQYDGSNVTDAGPTQSPTPTLTESATAGKPSGTYECRLVSMVGNDRQAGSAASSEVQLDSKQGSVSWTADSNTNVTGYEVYFTTGTGREFYFVDYVDGRTTTSYTLDKSDAEIRRGRPLDRHGDAPPSGVKVCALHKNRGWWGNTASDPARVYFSDPFQPDEVSPNSFFDVEGRTSGEEEIVAMEGGYYNSLIVFKKAAIYRITGTGEYIEGVPDFTVRETNASVGAVGSRCVVRVPAGARYPTEDGGVGTTGQATLAYFAPDNTIRLFDGDSDTIISFPKVDTLDDVHTYSHWLIWAEHDEVEKEITWYYASTSGLTATQDQQADRGITWNYRWGTWHTVTDRPFTAGFTGRGSDGRQILFAGSNGTGGPATGSENGKIYLNKTNNNLNGAGNDITAEYWTKPLHLSNEDGASAIGKTKRLRRMRLVTEAQSSTQNLTVEWYGDYADSGATASGSATVDMNESNKTHGQNKVVLKNSSGNYLTAKAPRLRFYDTADDAAWGVSGFELQYQVLRGEKGR